MQAQITIDNYVKPQQTNLDNFAIDEVVMRKRLRLLRKENKMAAKDIAQLLGIARPTYSCYEAMPNTSAYRPIPSSVIIKLAHFYNVSLDYLVGMNNDKVPQANKVNVFDLLDNASLDNTTRNYIRSILINALNDDKTVTAS